jgi:UDP-galactopyranose mutase
VIGEARDLICFSHLRWDFVYQRPNHLMSRAARTRRVFFVEEPIDGPGGDRLDLEWRDGVRIVRPVLGDDGSGHVDVRLAALVDLLVRTERIERPWVWYQTPMALTWTRQIRPSVVIYDCMDELALFRGAPPELVALEQDLLQRADVVFTGGRSLYEAKRGRHANVHAFPSAVDVGHFRAARQEMPDPPDQAGIGRPRLGWFGVIDERMDLELLDAVAAARPEWQLVLVGPVAKITIDDIPARPNIHLLGTKPYQELPRYIAGWDVALMPFAQNEATRYISPTKTPEYLAAGRPVVATPITDVVHPYGDHGLVRIAATADEFVAACEAALAGGAVRDHGRADDVLRRLSWDRTWAGMERLIEAADARAADRRAAARATAAAGPYRVAVPATAPEG